jgi:hypothetical protein
MNAFLSKWHKAKPEPQRSPSLLSGLLQEWIQSKAFPEGKTKFFFFFFLIIIIFISGRFGSMEAKGWFGYTIYLYYIILLFIVFKIMNTKKIYFLKLCLDGLKNLKHN